MTKTKLTKDSSSESPWEKCLVCGDTARGLNFNLLTCMACKTFFRKNVYKRSVSAFEETDVYRRRCCFFVLQIRTSIVCWPIIVE